MAQPPLKTAEKDFVKCQSNQETHNYNYSLGKTFWVWYNTPCTANEVVMFENKQS